MTCSWARGQKLHAGELRRDLLRLVRTIERRPGTPRAEIARNQIPAIKARRSEILVELARHDCEVCR